MKKEGHQGSQSHNQKGSRVPEDLLALDKSEIQHLQYLDETYRNRARERLGGIEGSEIVQESNDGIKIGMVDDSFVKVNGLDFELLEKERKQFEALSKGKPKTLTAEQIQQEKLKELERKKAAEKRKEADIQNVTKTIIALNIQKHYRNVQKESELQGRGKEYRILSDNCKWEYDLNDIFNQGPKVVMRHNIGKMEDKQLVKRLCVVSPRVEVEIRNCLHRRKEREEKLKENAMEEEESDDDIFGDVSADKKQEIEAKFAIAKETVSLNELKKHANLGEGERRMEIEKELRDNRDKTLPASIKRGDMTDLLEDLQDEKKESKGKEGPQEQPGGPASSFAQQSKEISEAKELMSKLLQKRKQVTTEAQKGHSLMDTGSYDEFFPRTSMTLEEMQAWKKEHGIEQIYKKGEGEKAAKGLKKAKKKNTGQEFDRIQKQVQPKKMKSYAATIREADEDKFAWDHRGPVHHVGQNGYRATNNVGVAPSAQPPPGYSTYETGTYHNNNNAPRESEMMPLQMVKTNQPIQDLLRQTNVETVTVPVASEVDPENELYYFEKSFAKFFEDIVKIDNYPNPTYVISLIIGVMSLLISLIKIDILNTLIFGLLQALIMTKQLSVMKLRFCFYLTVMAFLVDVIWLTALGKEYSQVSKFLYVLVGVSIILKLILAVLWMKCYTNFTKTRKEFYDILFK